MIYLSDLEEVLGSLDSVDMVSIFDVDKYDLHSEFNDMQDILAPYVSTLSPFDYTLFYMYYVNNAKAANIAHYLSISTTAVYKRIRTLRIKLKLIIYLNMNKAQLFSLLNINLLNDPKVAEYITQYLFHRTSKIGSGDLGFSVINEVIEHLTALVEAGPDNINNFVIRRIKRNGKRHQVFAKLKRVLNLINFIVENKAYRWGIFRGDIYSMYSYNQEIEDDTPENIDGDTE